MNKYRIVRHDAKNLVIQKETRTGTWRIVSYHGNSINSLISGLSELIVSQYIPDSDNLLESLEKLRLEYIKGLEMMKEIIENREDNV